MEEKKIRVAITQGDSNGTGYEQILKAFEDPAMLELCTPIIYGSPKIAAYHRKALELETNFTIIAQPSEARDGKLNMLACFDEEIKVDLGVPMPEAEEAARKSVDQALADYADGAFDVLVTAPAKANSAINKDLKALTVRMANDLRVALVTNNLALRDVADAITKPILVEKASIFHQFLKRDMRISSPRIAILALNPHTSEDSRGPEEQEIILPAIEELEQKGVQAFGPYPADDFFGSGAYTKFDGILAMYYDQGMAPYKSITNEEGIVVTAGLDIIHTAPAQSEAHVNAGKGIVSADSMRHAIYTAIDIFRNRQDYDAPLGNPLPKLYHEKRDDSEKVRFSVPKTKDTGRKEERQRNSEEKPRNSEEKPRSNEEKPRSNEEKPRNSEEKLRSNEEKPRNSEEKPRSNEESQHGGEE